MRIIYACKHCGCLDQHYGIFTDKRLIYSFNMFIILITKIFGLLDFGHSIFGRFRQRCRTKYPRLSPYFVIVFGNQPKCGDTF